MAIGNYRFKIEIDGITVGGFMEISGLSRSLKTFEYAEGGVNGYSHQIPEKYDHGNLVLKKGLLDKSLMDWFKNVNQGQIERKAGAIVLLDTAGEEMSRWNFSDAYPISFTSEAYSALGGAIAVETMELVHTGISTSSEAKTTTNSEGAKSSGSAQNKDKKSDKKTAKSDKKDSGKKDSKESSKTDKKDSKKEDSQDKKKDDKAPEKEGVSDKKQEEKQKDKKNEKEEKDDEKPASASESMSENPSEKEKSLFGVFDALEDAVDDAFSACGLDYEMTKDKLTNETFANLDTSKVTDSFAAVAIKGIVNGDSPEDILKNTGEALVDDVKEAVEDKMDEYSAAAKAGIDAYQEGKSFDQVAGDMAGAYTEKSMENMGYPPYACRIGAAGAKAGVESMANGSTPTEAKAAACGAMAGATLEEMGMDEDKAQLVGTVTEKAMNAKNKNKIKKEKKGQKKRPKGKDCSKEDVDNAVGKAEESFAATKSAFGM